MGSKVNLRTSFHPHIDGQVERTIETLEDMLSACAIYFRLIEMLRYLLSSLLPRTFITLASRYLHMMLFTEKDVDLILDDLKLVRVG